MSEGLPQGWARTTLSEIARPTRPRESPSDYPHLPFIGMENIEAHTMRLLGTVPASLLKSSAVHFQSYDVLYGRLRPYLNKVYRPDFEGLCSAEFIVFPEEEHFSTKWLAYLLNSSNFVSFSSHQNEGDRPRVDYDQIGTYEVSLPPRREQDEIVAEIEKQFTRLDAAAAALKRVQANLKRYRAAVLKAAYEGRLVPTEAELARKEGRSYETGEQLLARILKERRAKWEADQLAKMRASSKQPKNDDWKKKYVEPEPPDATNLPSLPGGWVWAKIRQVGQVQLGRQRAPKHHKGQNMRPYLRVANVFEDRIDISDVMEMNFTPSEFRTYQLHDGDVLLNEGQSLELIGRPAIYRSQFPGACFQNTLVRFRAFQGIEPRYALAVFLSYLHNQRFQRIARWTTNIAHLGAERFADLEFPLPPTDEQLRVADTVEDRTSVLRNMEAIARTNSRRADRLRQSILKRAFEGKLVPQDPNDEPTSTLLERIRAERATKSQAIKRMTKPKRAKVATVEVS